MAIRVGINGFGRMGRLTMRVAWELEDIQIVQVNDPAGDAATLAHLLNYDSIHGRWTHDATSDGSNIVVGDKSVSCTANTHIADTDWSGCDVVIEASGKFKKPGSIERIPGAGCQARRGYCSR